jgi:hypothetical protein
VLGQALSKPLATASKWLSRIKKKFNPGGGGPVVYARVFKHEMVALLTRRVLVSVLKVVEGESALDDLDTAAVPDGIPIVDYFDRSRWQGWVGVLAPRLEKWDDPKIRSQVSELAGAFPKEPVGGHPVMIELLESALPALVSLQAVLERGPADGDSNLLCQRVLRLATAAEDCGATDDAYDLATATVDISLPGGAGIEALSTFMARNAARNGRAHQIAASKLILARAILSDPKGATERQAEVFDAVEGSLEALKLARLKFQEAFRMPLWEACQEHPFLTVLQPLAASQFPADKRTPEWNQAFGRGSWPSRVTRVATDNWAQSLVRSAAVHTDFVIDAKRVALDSPATKESATSDWTDWTIDHPAFRGCIPYRSSILKDASFGTHILSLSHEVAHVYSFFGALGAATIALRIALLVNELRLWSMVSGTSRDLEENITKIGAAILTKGDAAPMLPVQISLELISKIQALQDIWTPWLEGIAVFCECASDPSFDDERISSVTQVLRGLMDFFPDKEDPEAKFKWYQELVQQFDEKAHRAIESEGPTRLSMYLRTRGSIPYLEGYLAVRSVVSSWRQAAGRAISGPAIFNLLLYVTRTGSFEAIPDLSLPAGDFHETALSKHTAWVQSLGKLTKEEIDDFVSPPGPMKEHRSGYLWIKGHPVPASAEVDYSAQEIAARKRVLDHASSPELAHFGKNLVDNHFDQSATLFSAVKHVYEGQEKSLNDKDAVETRANMFETMSMSNAFLPVATTLARFQLLRPNDNDPGRLMVSFRTRDDIDPTDPDSRSTLMVTITQESAAQLEKEYLRCAEPRMRVTRLSDLAGIIHHNLGADAHLLAMRYGEWVEVIGSSPATDTLLSQNTRVKDAVREYVGRRVRPSAFEESEVRSIAKGANIIERTEKWLQSPNWKLGEESVEVDSWARQIRKQCREMRECNHVQRQREAGKALLATIWGDSAAAEAVEKGFESIVRRPGQRESAIRWLFETARRPDAEAAKAAYESCELGVGLAVERSYGSDLRPIA